MMDLSVTLVKGFQPVTNIAKNSILDIAGVQNLPLKNCDFTLINIFLEVTGVRHQVSNLIVFSKLSGLKFS